AGGMGVVYAARDRQLDSIVALKTLREENPDALMRLKKEFRALQDLRHPNLISLGELFEKQGEWFFTMELVEGTDLFSWVREGGMIANLDRLYESLRQLTYGLLALHATGRLHRDVKPDNVMVDFHGRVVLMDFGLVTESADGTRMHENFYPVGTGDYMSPEQAASKALTAASDWYSVGVMLYEILTGEFPFSGSFVSVVLQKQANEAPDPAVLAPGMPSDLLLLCTQLLARRPEDRPTGEAILARLPCNTGVSAPSHSAISPCVRETLFVGRAAEEAVLRNEYARFVDYGSGAVLVHGASGLGKSELIRQFLNHTVGPKEGTVVLSGRCYEMETASFKALDPIVDALSQVLLQLPDTEVFHVVPRNASLLLRLFPVLGRVKAMSQRGITGEMPQDPYELRELAFNALRELFLRLSEQRRIVLFIDDIQWADADSHRLFQALFQDATAFPAFVLMAQRTSSSEEEARRSLARTLETLPEGTVSISVGPLSEAESQALARGLWESHLGSGVCSNEVVGRIVREGQGHPLFLSELVQHSLSNDTAAQEPVRLDEALWARITGLPGNERQTIEVLSIAGAPLSLAVLAVTLECPLGACMEVVNSLRIGHLVATRDLGKERRVDTYHDRVREAVLQRLPQDTRRTWHRRLAEGLEPRLDTPAELLAMHFELAQEHSKAAKYYQQAARKAQTALAYNQEAAYLEKAITLLTMAPAGEGEGPVALREWYAQALARAGRNEEAARVLLALLDEGVGSDPPQLQRQAGDYLMRSGRLDEGIRVLDDLLRTYNVRLPKHGWRLLLRLVWRRLRLRLRGLGFVRRDVSTISSEELARVDAFGAIAAGTGWVDTIWAAHAQTLYVHSSLNLGEPGRVLHALCMEMIFVSGAGKGESNYQRKLSEKIHEISR
ncbi:protein kinase, partial [Myxococcota bacterium]|nr:protein kinase [Myxococcota bacterium]